MDAATEFRGWDDWELVCRLLPLGWEHAARQQGALRHRRGIRDAATLLRVLLLHLADGPVDDMREGVTGLQRGAS